MRLSINTPVAAHSSDHANIELDVQGGHGSTKTLRQHSYDRQDPTAGSQHHHYRNHWLLLCLLPRLVPPQSIWRGADDVGLCCVSLHQHSHHGNTPPTRRETLSMEIFRWWRPWRLPTTNLVPACRPVLLSSSPTEFLHFCSSLPGWFFSFRLCKLLLFLLLRDVFIQSNFRCQYTANILWLITRPRCSVEYWPLLMVFYMLSSPSFNTGKFVVSSSDIFVFMVFIKYYNSTSHLNNCHPPHYKLLVMIWNL